MAEENLAEVIQGIITGVNTATTDIAAISETVRGMSARIDMLAANSHQHVWDIIDVYAPSVYRPAHPRVNRPPDVTQVLVICQGCHLPQTVELDGSWSREQIMRKATGDDNGDSVR